MQAKWAKAWRPERQQIPSDRDRLVQMWNNLATLLATHPIVSTEILRDMTWRQRGLRPRLVEPALLQQMIGTSSYELELIPLQTYPFKGRPDAISIPLQNVIPLHNDANHC